MKKTFICLLLAAIAVSAQNKQRIAVLPSVGDLDPQRLILLTNKVREIATRHLPMEDFNVLKQDVITKMIGEEELYRSCKEGVCIGDLAKKTNANYGARCDVVRLDDGLVLTFEMYSVNEEAIFETFTDYDVKDFRGMLASLEARLPATFQKMVSVSERAAAKDKAREQQKQEAKARQEYKPPPEPEPPKTYTVAATANPPDGGAVSRSPNYSAYHAGTRVTVTASPNAGYTFTGWSGVTAPASNSIIVTVENNLTLTANFRRIPAPEPAAPPQAQEAMPAPDPGEYHGGRQGEAGAQPETVASGPRNSAMGMPMRPLPGMANPAFLNEENYMSLRFAFANTLETFYRHETGFAMPIDPYSAAGVTWMMRSGPSYEATDPDGDPIGRFTSESHTFALTYANNVWSGLTVGGNFNVITQNIPDFGGSQTNSMRFGFGVDVGLTWKLLRHQMLGNHILGLSTNNIFNMIFDETTDEKYAAAVRFSLLSDFWERRIYYGADFVLKDFMSVENDWRPVDATKYMPWEFSQKLGFNILRIFKLYALLGFSSVEGGFDYYGFAFGVNMARFFNGRDIEGMMQFVSLVGSNEASHISFFARTEFGGYVGKSRK